MQYELSEREVEHFQHLRDITEEEREIVYDMAALFANNPVSEPHEPE